MLVGEVILMSLGLPGGSPGPGAQSGCVGLIIVAVASLIVVGAMAWLIVYALGPPGAQ